MTRKTDILKKYSYPLCLGGLFLIAFLLRAYRIGELPDVLHVDEAGLGYNAWCLANYGVDRYLNEWPIYPKNYYGGQSPLYTYCLVLLLKLFPVVGLTPTLVRIPALFSSMLAVICMAIMLEMIFGSKRITLAGTALMAFCPYFIMSGRYALDCNMMFSTSILAITLLLHYLQKPTWSALLWCGGGFALVLYTYALSYLVLPIFLVAFSLYMLYMKKINIGRLLVLAGEICVLALPLILFVICLVFGLESFRFLGINIIPTATERMDEFGKINFWGDFINCIKVTLTNGLFTMDAVEKFYTMYIISIPFILVGFVWALIDFVKSLISRRFAVSTIFVLYLITVATVMGVAGQTTALYRANAIFVCYVYFCVVGIRTILRMLHRYRKNFGTVVCIGYAIWTAAFLQYYYTIYSVADTWPYPNSHYFVPDQEALALVMETSNVDAVYIDSFFEEYFYFFYPCSPYDRNSAEPFGDGREFCMHVDFYTPIRESTIYMVRKENREFIGQLQYSGVTYETEEFAYYFVFTVV